MEERVNIKEIQTIINSEVLIPLLSLSPPPPPSLIPPPPPLTPTPNPLLHHLVQLFCLRLKKFATMLSYIQQPVFCHYAKFNPTMYY